MNTYNLSAELPQIAEAKRASRDGLADILECSSEEGITVGLLDSIMTAAHALQGRDLTHSAVQEALKDLRADKGLHLLLIQQVAGMHYDTVRRLYEENALEKLMNNKGR